MKIWRRLGTHEGGSQGQKFTFYFYVVLTSKGHYQGINAQDHVCGTQGAQGIFCLSNLSVQSHFGGPFTGGSEFSKIRTERIYFGSGFVAFSV